MTPCYLCQRPSEFMLYPHFAAYNATGERPRQPICGHCAADLISAKHAERVGPFALVKTEDQTVYVCWNCGENARRDTPHVCETGR